MNRDPLFEKILLRLNEISDDKVFEACVCDLLRDEWPNLVPVPGGADDGIDGSWSNERTRGILITTTSKDVIGNVTRNLTMHSTKQGSGIPVLVATSARLSPKQANNIGKRIRELGFVIIHQPYERQSIADRLYHNNRWLKELLGLSGNVPALSRIPMRIRPHSDLPVIGRENDLEWLRNTIGDRLLVGQPGSGKTFLAQQLVNEGKALFAVDRSMDRLADAIRDQEPAIVIVEDAHLNTEVVEQLRHHRKVTGTNFELVADCWPGGKASVCKALAIPVSQTRELVPISSNEIVKIAEAAGLLGPNWLLHEIVKQSMGFPGRAALLVHFCRVGKDLSDIVSGRALTDWACGTFSDLIGLNARTLLAAFAIGGEAGMKVDAVASVLGYSVGDVYQTMAQLALGGVVYELEVGRVCVMPSPLRSMLIADTFFNATVKLPFQHFVQISEDLGSSCKALIESQARGADIPLDELADLVRSVDMDEIWEHFIWNGERHARIALEHRPKLLDRFSNTFLHVLPDAALPKLLNDSVVDDRTLHNHPNHPLRLIHDWVTSAPRTNAIPTARRKRLWLALQILSEKRSELPECLRALVSIVTPEYETHEEIAGDRRRYRSQYGAIPIDDLNNVADLWPEIIEWLAGFRSLHWIPILEALDEWVYPGRLKCKLTADHYSLFRQTMCQILPEMARLARKHPAVLRHLSNRAHDVGMTLTLETDVDFAVLFPDDPADNKRGSDVRSKELFDEMRQLANKWVQSPPLAVAHKILWCINEASQVPRSWPDLTTAMCEQIAIESIDRQPWVLAMKTVGAPSRCIVPFLRQMLDHHDPRSLDIALECSRTSDFEEAGLTVLIASPIQSDAVENEIRERLVRWPEMIEHMTRQRQIPWSRVRGLLSHPDDRVVSATVDGIWDGRRENPLPSDLLDQWRKSVIRANICEFTLIEMFEDDNELAFQWLQWRTRGSRTNFRVEDKAFAAAVTKLTPPMRRLILQDSAFSENVAPELISALIDSDVEIYSWFLQAFPNSRHALTPLNCEPSIAWASLGIVALDLGRTTVSRLAEYAFATTESRYDSLPDKYKRDLELCAPLTTHSDSRIRDVAELCKNLYCKAIERFNKQDEWEEFENGFIK